MARILECRRGCVQVEVIPTTYQEAIHPPSMLAISMTPPRLLPRAASPSRPYTSVVGSHATDHSQPSKIHKAPFHVRAPRRPSLWPCGFSPSHDRESVISLKPVPKRDIWQPSLSRVLADSHFPRFRGSQPPSIHLSTRRAHHSQISSPPSPR